MIQALFLLAAGPAAIDACAAAVHTDLPSAVDACRVDNESIDLFEGKGLSEACAAAMSAGRDAGKSGPSLPLPMRNALIKAFDVKLATCRAPLPKDATPVRGTVNLWD